MPAPELDPATWLRAATNHAQQAWPGRVEARLSEHGSGALHLDGAHVMAHVVVWSSGAFEALALGVEDGALLLSVEESGLSLEGVEARWRGVFAELCALERHEAGP